MIQVWRLGGQRGTSTLEFIVVLPMLLFIFLGGLELSRAWFTATIATNAAREGARLAAATGPADPAIPLFANAKTAGEGRILEILTVANLTAPVKSVDCYEGLITGPVSVTCPTNSQVMATVTINFVTVAPVFLASFGVPNPLVLTEKSIMRRE